MSAWIDDVEVQLSSEDHGKDVTSANILLKKHQVSVVTRHCVNVTHCDTGNAMSMESHSMCSNFVMFTKSLN